MTTVDWYFDFISPYAYLQSSRLEDFAASAVVRCHPVLFAGLLGHWGQKGPAEMATKRDWTYRQIAWLAHKNGVPLKFPASHPFVPLRLLRLSIVLGDSIDVVRRLFAFVWRDGHLPSDDDAWQRLLAELGVSAQEIDAPHVKETLRRNTEEAIARGVFGVPTAVIDGTLIWGFDSTDMVHAAIAGDPFFSSDIWHAAGQVGHGVRRPGS